MSITLRLYIKQSLEFDPISFNPTWYTGPNPNNLQPTQTLQPARRWNNWNGSNVPQYIEVTQFVSDLHKLKLTWTAERDTNGFPTVGSIQPRKSASGSIQFEREAFFLLKQWLITDVSAPINSVDVKIEHVGCGNYENYIIKATDIRFCDDQATCTFDVTIKGKEESLQCIQKTLIADNWQGWFPPDGKSFQGGKKHPRFSYCNEIRPNGQLVVSWFFMSITSLLIVSILPVLISIFIAINGVIAVINAIIAVINTLGGNITPVNYINIPSPQNIKDALGTFYLEAAGCGREHPAPLIRDYISNVCSKCGVTVDATTAPIFFSPSFSNTTSNKNRNTNGGYISVDNPHYNATYFYAQVKRGIRRFKNITFNGFTQPDNVHFWIPENAPLLTLDMFLDQIKTIYNADWMLKSINTGGQLIPHLYFQRKDFYRNPTGTYIFDFSKLGADRHKIIEGICYEWNGRDGFVAAKGLYTQDSVDTCGNEARTQMNDFVSFGNTQNNPTLKGVMDKEMQFGGTRFRLDGASTDDIMDAMQLILNTMGILSTGFVGIIMYAIVIPALEEFADYALLLKDETCSLPKIIIWDGQSYENAKAVQSKMVSTDIIIQTIPAPQPEINTPYNNYPVPMNWYNGNPTLSRHAAETFVRGSSLTFVSTPFNYYTVSDFIGVVKYQKPAILVNYPMYFAPGFYDSMFDWFHFLDDPSNNPTLNMNFRIKIGLCCEDIQRIKPFKDGSEIELVELVKLDGTFYTDGKVTEYTIDYNPDSERGASIEIKGTV